MNNPAPQGSGEHKLVAENVELRKEVERYLTQAHHAEGNAVYQQRMLEEWKELYRSVVIQLREVESARDQALTLGAEQVLEIQELRQVVKGYRESCFCDMPGLCNECKAADLLEPKAKPTQQGDKE